MKKILFSLLLFLAILAIGKDQAFAQQNALKGQWLFNIVNQSKTINFPAPITFKNHGKATVATPFGILPIVYQETDTTFSGAVEFKMGLPEDGSDVTIVLHGTKMGPDNIKGVGYFVTQKPDPSNPLGVRVDLYTVEGVRQK